MKGKYVIYLTTISLATGAILLLGWRRKVANRAAEFIDEREIGQNQGFADAAFQKMIEDVGWKGGEAWCMYFAKAMYIDAFPKKADDIDKVLTGSTQVSWNNAKDHPELFKVITDGPPRKGDIIIWQSTKNTSLGHAGIVLKKDHSDTWYTVEGNSGLGGTREGDGVTMGDRLLVPGTVSGTLKLLGFIRLKA